MKSNNSYDLIKAIRYEENLATAMYAVGNDRAAEAAEDRADKLREKLNEIDE